MRVKLTAKHPRPASSERAPVRTGSTSARKPTRPTGPRPSTPTAGFNGARGEGAAQRVAASGRQAQVSRRAPARVRHGLKDRFPASGTQVVLALRAGHRRIGRRGAKGPAVRRAASRVAAIVRPVGTTASVRRVGLKVVAIVANVLRAALTVNAAKAHRAGLKAATALRVGTTVSVRPVGLKVAAIVANVLRAALTVNVAKARRAGLKAAATVVPVVTMVSVRPASLKVVAIAANALRVALTANAVRAHPAASKAARSQRTRSPQFRRQPRPAP